MTRVGLTYSLKVVIRESRNKGDFQSNSSKTLKGEVDKIFKNIQKPLKNYDNSKFFRLNDLF